MAESSGGNKRDNNRNTNRGIEMKVYEAINKVQSALSKEGISKNRRNQQQGYNFRGIDEVYNVLSPLLAEHGLCILPRMIDRVCIERQSSKGSALFNVTVEAEFDFVAAEDGSKHTVRTFGEAMDSADKATNKAMSAAYKYAAMQAFAIPTEGDNDADATTHDVAPRKRESLDEAAAIKAMRSATTLELLEKFYKSAMNRASQEQTGTINAAYEVAKEALTNSQVAA